MNEITNNKFEIYFQKVPLDKNSVQNPTLVELQNDHMKCKQKFEEFKTEYKSKYNELFNAINSPDMDNDRIKRLNRKLKSFVSDSEQDIKQCYLAVLEKQKLLVKNSDDNNFLNSHINTIQQDTNLKYKQYQKDVINLKKHQDELKNTIDHYNAMHTYVNDGLLSQTYIYVYIWLVITVLLVFFYFVNALELKLGIINNLLALLTLSVSLYFIYDGIYNYFNYELMLRQTYQLFYSWFLILFLLVCFSVINVLNLKFGLRNNILLLGFLLAAGYFIYSNIIIYLRYNN